MKKKFGALLVLATGALVALTGCGAPKEPEDHIWEPTKEIQEAELNYDDLKIQIDDKVIGFNEKTLFSDFTELFSDEEKYGFVDDEGNNISGENNILEPDSYSYVYLVNKNFYNSGNNQGFAYRDGNPYQPILELKVSNNENNIIAYNECDASIKLFNHYYNGGMYLSGGIPLSQGAISKTEGFNMSSLADDLEDLGFEKDYFKDNSQGQDSIKKTRNWGNLVCALTDYFEPDLDYPALGYEETSQGEYTLYIRQQPSTTAAKMYAYENDQWVNYFPSPGFLAKHFGLSGKDFDKAETYYLVSTGYNYRSITLSYNGNTGLMNSLQSASSDTGYKKICYYQIMPESKLGDYPDIEIVEE